MRPEDVQTKIRQALLSQKVSLQDHLELSSLEIVVAAVALEKAFDLRFEMDEISAENFKSLEAMTNFILPRLNSRG